MNREEQKEKNSYIYIQQLTSKYNIKSDRCAKKQRKKYWYHRDKISKARKSTNIMNWEGQKLYKN